MATRGWGGVAGLRINWRAAAIPLLVTAAIGLVVLIAPRLAEPPRAPEGDTGLGVEGASVSAVIRDPERGTPPGAAGSEKRRGRRRGAGEGARPNRRKARREPTGAAKSARTAAREPEAREPSATPVAPSAPRPATTAPPAPTPTAPAPPPRPPPGPSAGYREFGP